jgi:hypothetical protein
VILRDFEDDGPGDDDIDTILKESAEWDQLDGQELGIGGLFLRGLDLDTAARLADHWNLTDRFETRLNSALPSGQQAPTRPGFPSFEEWREGRFGAGTFRGLPEKAKQKARYLREMAEEVPGIESHEVMGSDPEIRDAAQRHHEVSEHYRETDYANMENFYGEQFGNAFDDAAEKFARQRPVDDAAPGTFTDSEANTADDYGASPGDGIDEADESGQ